MVVYRVGFVRLELSLMNHRNLSEKKWKVFSPAFRLAFEAFFAAIGGVLIVSLGEHIQSSVLIFIGFVIAVGGLLTGFTAPFIRRHFGPQDQIASLKTPALRAAIVGGAIPMVLIGLARALTSDAVSIQGYLSTVLAILSPLTRPSLLRSNAPWIETFSVIVAFAFQNAILYGVGGALFAAFRPSRRD